MAIARAQLVDTSLTRWYHCITRAFVARSCSVKPIKTARIGLGTVSRNSLRSSRWPSVVSR